jgi:hypothetical protein
MPFFDRKLFGRVAILAPGMRICIHLSAFRWEQNLRGPHGDTADFGDGQRLKN